MILSGIVPSVMSVGVALIGVDLQWRLADLMEGRELDVVGMLVGALAGLILPSMWAFGSLVVLRGGDRGRARLWLAPGAVVGAYQMVVGVVAWELQLAWLAWVPLVLGAGGVSPWLGTWMMPGVEAASHEDSPRDGVPVTR